MSKDLFDRDRAKSGLGLIQEIRARTLQTARKHYGGHKMHAKLHFIIFGQGVPEKWVADNPFFSKIR